MFRKTIFWTHLSVGIVSGIYILWEAVTGAILAFKPQLVAPIVKTPGIKPVLTEGQQFFKSVEYLHRWFGLPEAFKPVILQVKISLTVLFVLMIISGIYLWWPWKTARFQKGLSGKAQHWNWHNVVGIWSSPVLLILAISGILLPVKEFGKPFHKLMKRLHTGELLGFTGSLLVFVGALASIVLVVTGFYLAYRRLKAPPKKGVLIKGDF